MLLTEIIIAVLLGIISGIFTGLTPGIHVNTVSLLVLSLSSLLLVYTSPLTLAVFIVSTAVTHSFLNVIPAIYLGAPESGENILSVLPGHRFLLQGKGYEAVSLTILGSFLAIIVGIMITPIMIKTLPLIYDKLKDYIGYILLITSIFLVLRDKKKIWTFTIFLLSGVFGLVVLNLNMKNPLFPMLSSLFGIAGLLVSLKDNVTIPEQIVSKINMPKIETAKALMSGTLVGTFATIMPGLGPAQAAIIGSQLVKLTDKGFLILVGILDTLGMIMSFITIATINKARNGAVIVISRLMETVTIKDLNIFLSIALITGIISIFLALKISKAFSKIITKINYQKISITIIIFLVLMTFWFSSYTGLLILFVGSFIGMLPPLLGIGRNHLMGCLILPVILFFLL